VLTGVNHSSETRGVMSTLNPVIQTTILRKDRVLRGDRLEEPEAHATL
jgi:hypothetical protein